MPEPTTTPAAPVLAGTSENFDRLVLENSRRGPVLVDFWAAWAGPSQRQGELLRRLAQEYGGRFLLVSIDTDREKAVAERFGVKSLPSCRLFRRGTVVEQVHGMQTEADYRALIERHLVPVAGRVQAAALTAWQNGQQAEALQLLAEAAVAEPADPAIPLLMAKLLVRQGRHQDAADLLGALPPTLAAETGIRRLQAHLGLIRAAADTQPEDHLQAAIDADPDDHASRYGLAARRLLADDYDAALELLAELQARASDWQGGAAMQAILAVADVLGPDDARVRRVRRRLFDR
ncbi:tetratricopeptide repeat protein [Thiohalocapsa marina]|uniref:Tetratricopeptide repeat protein n=1 Tax=Thiohalocapsa marina TaxID=424902 RepID=A0A5M8FQU8_9GAMM|nr:tetratricopeptide repeat protein [Thiohalocapsa marina]KAA6186296.1 tetratricopeptide repeat protein [Thiohalocapsa marina]